MSNSIIYNIDDSGIGIFDGFIPDSICDYYIDFYKKSIDAGMGWSQSASDDNRITAWPPESSDVSCQSALKNIQKSIMNNVYPLYADKMKALKDYEWSICQAKIQKTEPGEGYHHWHTEASAIKNMVRLFVIQVYLNDVEEGGETEFLVQSKRVAPKKGRVVIFPTTYTHYHRGNPPLSGDKYILNMWAQYV
jgi:hypothetical protein